MLPYITTYLFIYLFIYLFFFRAINEAELERLCEEREVMTRKLAGLESDLKIQQQVRGRICTLQQKEKCHPSVRGALNISF